MDVMTSISFVYVVLPLAMAVYLICPARRRTAALLVFSLLFYFVAAPVVLLWMLGVAVTDLVILALMKLHDDHPPARKVCLAFSLVKNISCILLLGGTLQGGRAAPEVLLGLYVVTLSAMGYVLDVYRGKVNHTGSPVNFALYCFYFPRLAAGPLLPYSEFAPALKSPNTSPLQIAKGLGMFIQGAVKFGVLGQVLLIFYQTLREVPQGDASVLGMWVMVFVLILSVYYRFSGCADMAVGIGRMMGFSLPRNFNFPYLSKSVTGFFQRFNLSLTHYVNDALGPRFTNGENVKETALGLLVIGAAGGIWFGVAIGRVAWGIYLGLFLIMERYLYPGPLKKMPPAACRIYALLIIFLSFALFDAASLAAGAQTVGRMLGIGGLPFFSAHLGYLLVANRLLLIGGALFATGVFGRLLSFMREHFPACAYGALMTVINLLLLALFTAFSV